MIPSLILRTLPEIIQDCYEGSVIIRLGVGVRAKSAQELGLQPR